ncbi:MULTISPECIES: hypothetical protein [Arthrobacter]|uniref:Uncharacterized protein n=1 Tax=Arthrobacter terricola TaxID=2547396 RepID=A0A4R5KHS7_9MICC|nr:MULTISPECIES: hypothetical protein [Arthrobacter]MBT8161933.1 hypothetical protein [Arthrobacter sp. GN70]TDF94308.1 hypothetical protein E1809_14570 [Arthrobacter terricola]
MIQVKEVEHGKAEPEPVCTFGTFGGAGLDSKEIEPVRELLQQLPDSISVEQRRWLIRGEAPFYQIPGYFLTGAAAATAFGLINSLGNLGGFVAPTVFGALKDATGSYTIPSYLMGGILILAALLTAFLPRMFKSLQPAQPGHNAVDE